MRKDATRRRFLVGSATVSAVALAGCAGDGNGDDDNGEGSEFDDEDYDIDPDLEEGDGSYEVWALDQGRDDIFIYEPAADADGDDEFAMTDYIDVNDLGIDADDIVPHMIDFSSDYAYAAIACTAGGRTLVFDTEEKELVADIETGPSTHMAAFSPGDEYITVDVMGDMEDGHYGSIVRLDADTENGEFEEVDRIELGESDEVSDNEVEPGHPICHQYTADGRSLHTLGPEYGNAGLVIVDHDEFEIERAYTQEEAPTNCGTMPHYEDEKFYLTAGAPSDPDEGEDGVGHYYVYDTAEDEFILEEGDTEGVDAHGFWFTPDGEELWILNRETNDGVVVDPETDEPVEDGYIEQYGPDQADDPADSDAPDIMWSSPDGEYMFVSLRGPDPVSGDPHAATGITPGFSVMSIEDREIVDVVEPHPIDEFDDDEIEAAQDGDGLRLPDFHGLGVRVVDDFDTEIENSPGFN
ncbi:cell surface protein [Natronorubrum daqingense]|uniref:Cell surface protein n=1 Tax=Natronorubrum daqingense TaxID=588898 RepID=A0A1N7DPJ9_9EURY|nr:cell surface protein [Natronorubrum daqingense]APX96100.1 cell surface protein [Natronorubrum daqingense]SIR77803.1 hypothetical protein SAMN05421809_2162 [Natronorubrum daqingense]